MRVAVITPYYRPRLDWLKQCHDSVLAQTHSCTHILVADGEPIDELDRWNIQHLRCSKGHADYGDTPRAIGSLAAIGQGFEAIAYLDADNWYKPEHIESLVKLHHKTGAPVCISHRDLHHVNGTHLELCPETDGTNFADTSCLFFTMNAFHMVSYWALMDPKLHAIGDRMVMLQLRNSKLKRAFSNRPTLAYRTTFPGAYDRAGLPHPPEIKLSLANVEAAYDHLISRGGPNLRPKTRFS